MEGLLHSTDTTLSGLFLIGVVWHEPPQGDMSSWTCGSEGLTTMLVIEGRDVVFSRGVWSSPAIEQMSSIK